VPSSLKKIFFSEK
jgi:hypothetical protein